MIRFHKPHVVFLMETKLKKNGVEVLKHKLGFDKGDEVAAIGRSGGLCILWKQEIDLVVKSKSENFIDAEIREGDSRRKWRFTGVYGWSKHQDHHRTWSLLRSLHNGSDNPWLCVGDFNQFAQVLKNREVG
ncbi:hypothetical protein LINGRAHAP2_LOCUS4847 [Linum grandiflorum]